MSALTDRIVRNTPEKDTEQVALTMFFALFFGLCAVFVSLLGQGTVWRGMLWAGAWSSVGWFLGFLFGIPRYLSTDTARTPGATSLDRARQDAATTAEAAKSRRAEATAAAQTQADADAAAQTAADAARQAADQATQAATALQANPQDTTLKAAADAADQAASEARQLSDAAAQAAQAAADKKVAAEAAATEADSKAADAAKRREVAASSPDTAATPRASLTVNTNLEQISDWLTKIIVGVSLVESQTLLDQMQHAATFMARSMATPDQVAAWLSASAASAAAPAAPASATPTLASFSSMESVAYAVMLYFLATGLLGSYLLTRLFLQRALDNAATRDAT